MLTKIFGPSGRHEAEPPTSPLFPNEHFLAQITAHDDQQRPFYVKYFYDLKGYKLSENPLLCHDCSEEPATIRAEIYSGTMEPQGSEFYGPLHSPKSLEAIHAPWEG